MREIGTLRERSLHAALKALYAQHEQADLSYPTEVPLAGFVIDVQRDDELVEIQTANFGAMKRKLTRLLPEYAIRIVYPVAVAKWIVRISAEGEIISRRKSPKKGRQWDVFGELMRIPTFLSHPNLTIELAMIHEENVLVDDGSGSWRRKGWRNADRRLLKVISQISRSGVADWTAMLPPDLPMPFTVTQLAKATRVRPRLAGRIAYTLRQCGAIHQNGKAGNAFLYQKL